MQFNAKFRSFVVSVMLLAATQAQATLISYTANGEELVYSSVSNVTWTKDANLLSSMFASQGFNTVVNAIIAASPIITNTPNYASPTGTYAISSSDFNSNGRATWFGAMAFINYLNNANYAGSNQWRLPTVATQDDGFNITSNGSKLGNEYSELFYQELTGVAGNSLPETMAFQNEQMNGYWNGTEYMQSPGTAWVFYMHLGEWDNRGKATQRYFWAVSPGHIATVPEPENLALFLAGLGLVAGVVRCRHQDSQVSC